jgi:membrane protein
MPTWRLQERRDEVRARVGQDGNFGSSPRLVASRTSPGRAGPRLRSGGGRVLLGFVGFVALVLFWWLTMWFLLGGRIARRPLFPAAVATALIWLGMEVVFSFLFSGTVTSDDKKYGAIGVVFALMTWLIVIGVVIILGAIAGIVWDERHQPSSEGGNVERA